MAFKALGLADELVRALEAEGYEEPTPIQLRAIPLGLEGRDVVGSAQTGTGKTAAFLLPILQRLRDREAGSTRALILVPTRELAEQVLERARTYGQHTAVDAAAVYGGVSYGPQTKALKRGVDIVIATPGRLIDHLGRGHLDCSAIEVLVLDEADRMLDMGFAPDVYRILEQLPHDRQTMLFSATISSAVDALAHRAMEGHAAVEIGARAQTADGVEHVLIAVDWPEKPKVLAEMLSHLPLEGRKLIFTGTKDGAETVGHHLQNRGTPVAVMHGGRPQRARNEALEQFRSGRTQVMVATDVAARGIDVENIAMVVNYDVPNDPEVYVHRVGRTARAGAKGLALTLMSPHEWTAMREVERLIGMALPRETLPGFEPSVAPMQPKAEKPVPEGPRLGTRRGRRGRR